MDCPEPEFYQFCRFFFSCQSLLGTMLHYCAQFRYLDVSCRQMLFLLLRFSKSSARRCSRKPVLCEMGNEIQTPRWWTKVGLIVECRARLRNCDSWTQTWDVVSQGITFRSRLPWFKQRMVGEGIGFTGSGHPIAKLTICPSVNF